MRGYFLDDGTLGKNDRNIYDDAIFLCAPGLVAGFNGNVDPSRFEPGVAVLQKGLWTYKLGIHGLSKPPEDQYPALVQARPVTVLRDGGGFETGFFGINIHRGCHTTTGSEGCQTILPEQWDPFYETVKNLLAEHSQETVPYLLIDQSEFKGD